MTEREQIRGWIVETCARCGVPEMAERVFFRFNRRFTTFLDDIRRTKLASKLLTSRVSAQPKNACRA